MDCYLYIKKILDYLFKIIEIFLFFKNYILYKN